MVRSLSHLTKLELMRSTLPLACLCVTVRAVAISTRPYSTAALRPRPAVARCLPPVAYQSGGSDLDPYKTLGLERGASTAEIKKAFRDKALSAHPDKNPDLDREEAQARCSSAWIG